MRASLVGLLTIALLVLVDLPANAAGKNKNEAGKAARIAKKTAADKPSKKPAATGS